MSLWLSNANQRFKQKAIYYQQIASNDGEELRYSIQGTQFRFCEYELARVNRMIVAEGVVSRQATFAIMTDYAGAINFEPDDMIKIDGHDRRILWRGKIKNHATPNAVAYVIGLI